MIKKDTKKVLSILVEDDVVGRMYISEGALESNKDLIDAVENNRFDTIVKFRKDGKHYQLGSKIDESTGYFSSDSTYAEVEIDESTTTFGLVGDKTLLAIQQFKSPVFDAIIAAYESNPTLKIELNE